MIQSAVLESLWMKKLILHPVPEQIQAQQPEIQPETEKSIVFYKT